MPSEQPSGSDSPVRSSAPPPGPSAHPLITLAIVLWAIALSVVFIRVLVQKPGRQSVYPNFSQAARAWMHSQPIYISSGSGFRYSPIVAPALVPFALLPDRLGECTWRLLNAAVLIGGLWCACRAGIPRDWGPVGCALIFLLVLPDAVANLNNGQPNALVLGLLLIAAAAVARDRWWIAAAAVALAALLKVYPLAFGLILIALYRRPFAWRLLLCLAVGAALPLVLQHHGYVLEQYRAWFGYVWTENRQTQPLDQWYRDVRLLARVWLNLDIGQGVYRLIEAVVGAAIAAIGLYGQHRAWPRPWLLGTMLALSLCWMTLLGPATESVTYLLAAPAIAWALIEAFAPGVARWDRIYLVGALLLMLSGHVAAWFGQRAYQTLGPAPAAALLTTAWWFWHCFRSADADADNLAITSAHASAAR